MTAPFTVLALRESYVAQSRILREVFDRTGDGRAAVAARSDLVDSLILRLHSEFLSANRGQPKGYCLVALGGYGRRELFPYSDVDLLFLSAHVRSEAQFKGAASEISKALWDARLRLSSASRTLAECDQLREDNVEFHVALLDCRYLAGDEELFANLREKVLPQLVVRERRDLVRSIAEMARMRHAKYGNTIFHLEPNVKDAPGGLRDYHMARWLVRISELDEHARWVDAEEAMSAKLGSEGLRAFEFLCVVRCFLHFRQGRDDNVLSYGLQAEMAARGLGHRGAEGTAPERWVREYFRHARAVEGLAGELLDEVSAGRSLLYELFEDWRSRLSTADFYVTRGRVFLRRPVNVKTPRTMLGLFEFVARHGLRLSAETERHVRQAHRAFARSARRLPDLWASLASILVLPRAAEALRVMHRLSLLGSLLPEFQAIDSLVVRDFYHRYTVDEHTFRTIEHLHRLRQPEGEWDRRFAEIFREVDRPERLFFALLYHDVGKGTFGEDHVRGSLQAAEAALERLRVDEPTRETVLFLIAHHLEMSGALQRRDIFDAETVRLFAETVGTAERLRMLTLMTHADIRSVNPEALTPWKAEMLWQLYAATANYLTRSVDEDRLSLSAVERRRVAQILKFLPASTDAGRLATFLEGFPGRYLLTRLPQEIGEHYQMAQELGAAPVRVQLAERGDRYELTLVTHDRSRLFAQIAGALAASGMNIVKGEAFANRAGVVVDAFQFTDLYRALELNPSEKERFQQMVVEVLAGSGDLEGPVQKRGAGQSLAAPKVEVETSVRLDDSCSAHSTLLELVAQDRPGLLYEVTSILAELDCNIEVALIDTEGPKAVDTFYLTQSGKKLNGSAQRTLRETLLQRL